MLIIDDFSSGNVLIAHPLPAIPAIPGYVENWQPAAVPGGQRYLVLWPDQKSPHEVFVAVEDGHFVAARLRDQRMYMTLGYGQQGGMNLDLSGMSALRLEGLVAIEPLKLTVYVQSADSGGGNPSTAGVNLDIDRSCNPVNLDIARPDFKNSTASAVDWAHVSLLALAFTDPPMGAFSGLRMEAICALM